MIDSTWCGIEKMPLHALLGGSWQGQRLENVALFGIDPADPFDRFAVVVYPMLLDPREQLQRSLRRARRAVRLHAHAHHPMQHGREEADERVGRDAVGKA